MTDKQLERPNRRPRTIGEIQQELMKDEFEPVESETLNQLGAKPEEPDLELLVPIVDVDALHDALREPLRAEARRMDACLPKDASFPAERPAGWPAELAWPPDKDEMLGVAGLYVGFAAPIERDPWDEPGAWRVTDYGSKPEWLAERYRESGLTPEQIAKEDLAIEESLMGPRASRTANGMPESTGWASCVELQKRLRPMRDVQLLEHEMQERQKRGLTARDKAWWDLELTKLAARETRDEGHLYEFLYQFCALYPAGQTRYDTEQKNHVTFGEYYGYVIGTVRKALAETPQPAWTAPPHRTVAELMEDERVLTPPVAVVPRLAWQGRDTLFAGREKLAGKSTILTAAAAAVTTGGLFLGESARRGHVLWVSADLEPEADIVQRFLRFKGEPSRMKVVYPSGDFAARLDALVGTVASLDPALVVVDSLSMFTLVNEAGQAAEWNACFGALRERLKPYDAARAFVHHTNKGKGEYRDSTAIGAAVDQIIYYENPDPKSGSTLREAWGLGRIVGWRPFRIDLDGATFNLIDDEHPIVIGGDRLTVLEALTGQMTVGDWRAACTLDQNAFKNARQWLERNKHVRYDEKTKRWDRVPGF